MAVAVIVFLYRYVTSLRSLKSLQHALQVVPTYMRTACNVLHRRKSRWAKPRLAVVNNARTLCVFRGGGVFHRFPFYCSPGVFGFFASHTDGTNGTTELAVLSLMLLSGCLPAQLSLAAQ